MARLSSAAKKHLIVTVNKAVKKVAKRLGGEHRDKGGYFRLFALPSDRAGYLGLEQLYEGWVGGTSNRASGKKKYQVVSFEKAIRLAQQAQVNGHVSSWQSEDQGKGLFGGAVLLACRVGNWAECYFIFSFSGLPWKGDEAAMLLTTYLEYALGRKHLRTIARISNNEVAEAMLDPRF
jgi:hypothetical protein